MLRDWRIKAVVQKSISMLPGGRHLNYFLQRNVTKGAVLNEAYMSDKLDHVTRHLRYWKEYRTDQAVPASMLELGTGWFPVVPLAFRLAGSQHILTTDLDPHIRPENVQLTIRKLLDYQESGKLSQWMQASEEGLQSLEAALSKDDPLAYLNIDYVVGDAATLKSSNQFDLSLSNNVLEHVSEEVIVAILKNFKKLTAEDGLGSHFIDLSDHFAHFDSSINVFNFLRFSKKQWDRIDNNLQPQNRLRIPQFRQLFEEAGWTQLLEDRISEDLPLLEKSTLHQEFEHMSKSEMAVYHVHYVHDSGSGK